MKYYLKYGLVAGLASLLAFTLPACSDDDSGDDQKIEEPENPETPNDPDTPDDPDDPDDPDEPYIPDTPIEEPDDGWQALLLPGMATDVEVANKSTARLSVMLVSLKGEHAGEGMVGEKIKWGVESGDKSVTLYSGKSTTAEEGISNMNIAATDVAGNAVVVASNANAPKTVRFNVKVLDKPTGNLNATAFYDGAAPVKNYTIRIYDGSEVQCAHVELESGSILNSKTEGEAEPILPVVEADTALFENLSTEMNYTLIAYGFSEEGAPVAAGCLDSGTAVRGSETTDAAILLNTIDLDPVTTYHVRSYFDLGDVASALGSVGKFVVLVTNFADNPGAMLYDIIIDLLSDYVSGVLGKAIDKVMELTKLDTKLAGAINDVAKKNATVCKVGLFACQFRNIVRTMEFMGDLDIQKVGNVELSGTNSYNGLAAYWRMNCETDSNGDYKDSNCGRMPLSTTQLGLDNTLNFLEGAWQGSVANGYDKLSIESHELSLHYGKIVVYLIDHVLLPKVANGATNFSDALSYWLNCDSIGQWLSDTLTRCIGVTVAGACVGWDLTVSKSQGVGWCKTATDTVGSLLNFATAYAELQKAGSDLMISGTAYFDDSNADNVVDDIRDGKWNGNMTITTSSDDGSGNVTSISTVTGVKGIWSAYNRNNVKTGSGDNDIYCTYPKSSSDSNDQICSYPPINVNSLVGSAMCKEYIECSK